MDKPNEIRPGEVEITLDGGWKLTLRPTLKAAMAVSRQYGGLNNAVSAVLSANLEAFIYIVSEGADLTERGRERVGEAVFRSGMVSLVAPLTKYLVHLGNGGRPVKDADADEERAGPPDPSRD